MNKCRECTYFTYGGITDQDRRRYGLYELDGLCNKYFPRGYLGRKPPHVKYSNDNACFQFEKRAGGAQTAMDIGREET